MKNYLLHVIFVGLIFTILVLHFLLFRSADQSDKRKVNLSMRLADKKDVNSSMRNLISQFNSNTSVALLRNSICSPGKNLRASDVSFTWGPWPATATYNVIKNLTDCAKYFVNPPSRIIRKGFISHLGMRWATHNLFHSMTEAEMIFYQACKGGLLQNLSEIELILLQFHPSYETSLFSKVLHTFIGVGDVSWHNNGIDQSWLIEEAYLPTVQGIQNHNCSYKSHLLSLFPLSIADNGSRVKTLIINRKGSRKLANSQEIIRAFTTRNYAAREVFFEDLTFKEQALIIQNHSIIVSPHGAAWTMVSLFSKPYHTLIEVMHVTDPCSLANGHHAHPWRKWVVGGYFPLFSVRDTIWGSCKKMNGDGDMVANITELLGLLRHSQKKT